MSRYAFTKSISDYRLDQPLVMNCIFLKQKSNKNQTNTNSYYELVNFLYT